MNSPFYDILGDLLIREYNISGIPAAFTADSRKVFPGMGFVAITGTVSDGHKFIPGALERGAALIVMEKEVPLPSGTPALLVRESTAAFARLYRHSKGDPDSAMKLLGVTGTNGKTTSAFLLEHIFNFSGLRCGLVSTVEYRTGSQNIPGDRTTPDSATLFDLFAEMKDNSMEYAAMELSSHSLVQNRAAGIGLRAGIFTNLTGDHLDYHGDMEHYYQAKKRMFTHFLDSDGVAVINGDDPWGKRLAAEISDKVRCAVFGSGREFDHRISDWQLDCSGVSFMLHTPEYGKLHIDSGLTGFYNIQNITGAVIAALDCGIAPEKVLAALKEKIRVPGRLESFNIPGGGTAFVDYAHTDDALKNVLGAVRKFTSGKVLLLFGAGGDRDKSKRPRMGKTAAEYADFLVVTSDNPRSEKSEDIIKDILQGIPESASFIVELDRREAIRKILEMLEKGDCAVIAGKAMKRIRRSMV
ncbi:MAG: UDP-N-acetylmuramoyl-L-alanyl-D-glutamate--2,6-diaminopimelate ligase [Lentisphaeria bacterium]|nr:UDP-N-acetylmuramoyl-L-alanyl-D-glutamate--2,6-diaminopimelate ligase [Lentisphaeria bacterium]